MLLLQHPELAIDGLLVIMLSVTMLVALRLERALGVLRRDRASLEKMVDGFNQSTRQAEQGIERLQSAAQSAGQEIVRQIDRARRIEGDLQFLIPRAEKTADRLGAAIEQSKTGGGETCQADAAVPIEPSTPRSTFNPLGRPAADPDTKPRSQAERDLLMALRAAR